MKYYDNYKEAMIGTITVTAHYMTLHAKDKEKKTDNVFKFVLIQNVNFLEKQRRLLC